MTPESALAPPPRPDPARPVAAVTLPVMGIPVRFESSSPAVIAMAEAAFGAWRVLERERAPAGGGHARVRIRVRGGSGGMGMGGPVDHGVPRRGLLVLSGPGVRGCADAAAREAMAEVDAALVAHERLFRARVLEAMTLFLVTRQDREPLHAAAVARGGAALLLAAPSGVGKSTTVYAARRAGLGVLAEDAVFLQLDPFRVWGMPGAVHLHPDSARFFPELADARPVALPNGKRKLALEPGGGAAAVPPFVTRAAVCLLARGPRPALERVDGGELERALTSGLEPGFRHFAASIVPRVRRLAAPGGWRLTLPPHPDDAVPLLHRILDELG